MRRVNEANRERLLTGWWMDDDDAIAMGCESESAVYWFLNWKRKTKSRKGWRFGFGQHQRIGLFMALMRILLMMWFVLAKVFQVMRRWAIQHHIRNVLLHFTTLSNEFQEVEWYSRLFLWKSCYFLAFRCSSPDVKNVTSSFPSSIYSFI